MRTKEIDVLVSKELIEKNVGIAHSLVLNREENPGPEFWHKAKLLIELPEKSVTITESEFDDIWFAHIGVYDQTTKRIIKQRLFGDTK